jgi:hypothetical protein
MAGVLVNEGVEQVLKGVPVVKEIEGMKNGIRTALDVLQEKTEDIRDLMIPTC